MTGPTILKLAPAMNEHSYAPALKRDAVEAKYGATYVGDFPGKVRGGGWTADIAVSVFYQPEPKAPYTNRYFGLFNDISALAFGGQSRLMITDADYVEGREFDALLTPEGIVYSTCRHDYREVGGSSIDGGWDYYRGNGGPVIKARVMNGKIEQVEA